MFASKIVCVRVYIIPLSASILTRNTIIDLVQLVPPINWSTIGSQQETHNNNNAINSLWWWRGNCDVVVVIDTKDSITTKQHWRNKKNEIPKLSLLTYCVVLCCQSLSSSFIHSIGKNIKNSLWYFTFHHLIVVVAIGSRRVHHVWPWLSVWRQLLDSIYYILYIYIIAKFGTACAV